IALKAEACTTVEGERLVIPFVYEETNQSGMFEQAATQLPQTTQAISLTALFRIDINAFQINRLRCIRNYVCFEHQGAIFNQHPNAALLDTTSTTLWKSLRIGDDWINQAELFTRHSRVRSHHETQVFERRHSQAIDRGLHFRPVSTPLFQKQLTAYLIRNLAAGSKVTPEPLDFGVFTHNHMDLVRVVNESRKGD